MLTSSEPSASYSSNIKEHWLQIFVTNRVKIKKFEILQELPKWDTMWVNTIGKMVPVDLTDTTLQFIKKHDTYEGQ